MRKNTSRAAMVRVGMTLDLGTISRLVRLSLQRTAKTGRFISKSEVVRELIREAKV